jgi:hypothetical protein
MSPGTAQSHLRAFAVNAAATTQRRQRTHMHTHTHARARTHTHAPVVTANLAGASWVELWGPRDAVRRRDDGGGRRCCGRCRSGGRPELRLDGSLASQRRLQQVPVRVRCWHARQQGGEEGGCGCRAAAAGSHGVW